MRGRLMICCFCLTLLLGGCSALLNRSYSSETPHTEISNDGQDPGVLRAENYQELVTALLYLVANHEEEGVIRLYEYSDLESVKQDRDAAGVEVAEQDPLGAYAVSYMTWPTLTRVISYYEIEVTIVYQRSFEQISNIISATGVSAILGEIQDSLFEFQEETVLRISYFDPAMTQADIVSMVEQAYYNMPAAALGLPQITVNLYPEQTMADEQGSSQQRLVEIILSYGEDKGALTEKRDLLLARSDDMTADLKEGEERQKMEAILSRIQGVTGDEPPGGDYSATAYGALVEGAANEEGLALAASLLCQKAGIPCVVVRGWQEEAPHFWNLVQIDGSWYHVDLTQAAPQLLGDGAMWEMGYVWSEERPASQSVSLSLE